MIRYVVFFDGKCPLCHWAVTFFLKIDKEKVLYFSPLESDYAKACMGEDYDVFMEKDTVIFKRDSDFYLESEAVAEGLKLIDGYQWLGRFILIFPRRLRNFVYRVIAKLRPQNQDTCPMLPPEHRSRFIYSAPD